MPDPAPTPGPWFVLQLLDYDALYIIDKPPRPIPTDWPAQDFPGVEIIAKIEPGPRAIANARLIVQAWLYKELTATLREMSQQKLAEEMDGREHADADFEGAYETMIEKARAALAKLDAQP